MLESRVMLLSDYAQKYVEKGRKASEKKGFWGNMIGGVGGSKASERKLTAGLGDELQPGELAAEDFAPFCRIDDRTIYIKKNASECWVAIVEDDALWDLSEWGEDYCFITRFLAEVYFMITRDDFHIDDDERTVFQALAGCIEATGEEIIDARNLVYWTLLDNVVEDEVITDEEHETLARIRKELELDEKNVKDLHQKIIEDYYSITCKFSEDGEPDPDQIENIKEMAARLGVTVKF
ncbi:MAG: hypothetical protein CVV42_01695 [Candidatus Riflebacteria bacterium HGW-Riflebacteria-2]|jgi:hypothetical protein|nr:MAG: hypothetical protein CVV42_01695 [Candidatus Riflebacteria bacterium HGW-Riflebacteria-2]